MYFGNIANTELNHYPKPSIDNFTIKLSDILHKTSGTFDNKLFKIEEIITDKIYKVYPLFTCKNISSSNSNDKIMDNQLIICTVNSNKETYITFTSNDGEIKEYLDYGTYYEMGDDLTTSQLNSIISLMRRTPIQQGIRIQPHTINTSYGVIDFIFTGEILDNGIRVTDLTTLKCRLSNPVFRYSNYHLNVSVLRLGSPNIETEDAVNKTIIPVTIDLSKDTWVDIDTSDLETNDIIQYDCILHITHDKPEIHYLGGLEVTANPNPIQTGSTTDIYGQLIDTYGYEHQESNVKVYFYEKLEPTLTVTATADVIQSSDTTDISCSYIDADGSKVVGEKVYFYEAYEPTLIVNASPNPIQSGDTTDIKATLKDSNDGSRIPNEKIYFYEKEEE